MRALAALGALDLVGVVWGDREHPIGELHSSTKEVHAVIAHVEILALEFPDSLGWEAKIGVDGKLADHVLALVAHVVDDEYGPCVLVGVVPPVLVHHVNRHQRSLPVVGDEEHILAKGGATKIQDKRCLQGRQGEQGESKEVVTVLLAFLGIPVEACSPVVAYVIDEDVVRLHSPSVRLVLVKETHLMLAAIQPNLRATHISAVGIISIVRTDHHSPVTAHCEFVAI
mmetsp:Transcript_116970/g.249930  ORF Transcript_116970/g.249930 Transcript_116970/m.249930 type:complete len:227 (-) Transcript_116970:2265-2945(-)